MWTNRKVGKPRQEHTYRSARRNYDTSTWEGVKPDKIKEHPPLTKVVSKRGEVHYTEIWD